MVCPARALFNTVQCHTVTVPLCHTVQVSQWLTVTVSHCHTVRVAQCHTVRIYQGLTVPVTQCPYFKIVTVSYSHTITVYQCHTVPVWKCHIVQTECDKYFGIQLLFQQLDWMVLLLSGNVHFCECKYYICMRIVGPNTCPNNFIKEFNYSERLRI